MAAKIKACTSKGYRRRNAVIVILFALISCLGLVMTVYNLVTGMFLFALACFIATILAVTYVFIRINTVFTTSVSLDRSNLYLKNWNNDFLPYDYENKIKILSEFIPAKTKVVEIPINEVHLIIIGTKNFIKRNIDPSMEFVQNVKHLEGSKDYYRKRTVSSMDILYVETYDRECYYMPIVKFESKDIKKIIQTMQRRNADLDVKASGKEYRSLRLKG